MSLTIGSAVSARARVIASSSAQDPRVVVASFPILDFYCLRGVTAPKSSSTVDGVGRVEGGFSLAL